jgi:toxin FitB
MSWLIDTNVLSASFNPARNPKANDWLLAHGDACWVSCLTLGEIESGIARARRNDPPFANRLAAWQSLIMREWEERILPITLEIARNWGEITDRVGRKDTDLLLAATAHVYGLTVVTRNIRDFEKTGVPLLNPWED